MRTTQTMLTTEQVERRLRAIADANVNCFAFHCDTPRSRRLDPAKSLTMSRVLTICAFDSSHQVGSSNGAPVSTVSADPTFALGHRNHRQNRKAALLAKRRLLEERHGWL